MEFKFTAENIKKAKKQLAKYPENRSKSAIKSLLYLAQEQNSGWLSKEAMNYISEMLNISPIRVYEVATFYTMFNFKPVGKFIVQVCGTTPCMLRGSEEVMKAVKKYVGKDIDPKLAEKFFTIKEVECLGACVNAPVVQINDDYYEDLDSKKIVEILENLQKGREIKSGSQIGRTSSEPLKKKAK